MFYLLFNQVILQNNEILTDKLIHLTINLITSGNKCAPSHSSL